MLRGVALVAVAAAAAHAASVGYKIGSCDPLGTTWGCPVGRHGTGPDNLPNNRLNCTVNGRLSTWVCVCVCVYLCMCVLGAC